MSKVARAGGRLFSDCPNTSAIMVCRKNRSPLLNRNLGPLRWMLKMRLSLSEKGIEELESDSVIYSRIQWGTCRGSGLADFDSNLLAPLPQELSTF
jgi:hypothetical protein